MCVCPSCGNGAFSVDCDAQQDESVHQGVRYARLWVLERRFHHSKNGVQTVCTTKLTKPLLLKMEPIENVSDEGLSIPMSMGGSVS